MSDEEGTGAVATVDDCSPSRRWFIRIAIASAASLGLYGVSRYVFHLWMFARVPADAPRIAFSLDDTWLNQIGVTDTTYQQAITRAQGRLIRFEPDMARADPADPSGVGALLDTENIDGLLLTGGGDVDPGLYGASSDDAFLVNRARDDFEIALIRGAIERGIPILGICRGCQILNVAMGGTLKNLRTDEELKDKHFSFSGHPLHVTPGSRVAEILGVTYADSVYSFHGQAVGDLGEGLVAAAVESDGVVEAVEYVGEKKDVWAVGVQWHPEMAVSNEMQNRLFRSFVAECAKHRDRRLAP